MTTAISSTTPAQPLPLSPSPSPSTPPRPPRSLVLEFFLGGAATMTACLFTNPIEVVKTRMQVQGELLRIGKAQQLYRNPFQAFLLIGRSEGLRGLQGGLGPAVLYQLAMNGTRLGAYEPIKRAYTDGGQRKEMWRSVAAGSTSGVLGALCGSPFFLIKVRLQVQSGLSQQLQAGGAVGGVGGAGGAAPVLPVGHQHQYRGALSGLLQVWRAEGVRGLYRGATAAMLRVGVGSGVQLSTYDRVKALIVESSGGRLKASDIGTHFVASMVSGVVITLAMNPFDVMSTRMYNQKVEGGKGVYYSSVVDCGWKIAKSEGLAGFYKGFVPHFLRLGPHTILTFVFWEQLKQAATRLGY